MSNHCAPNELARVVMNAMLSPQPGLPRRQMPYTPLSLSVIAAAASSMCPQVGLSGISMPAASIKSLRYMIIELSP